MPRIEVWPLIITAEPVAGRLKVVSDTTRDPPGVKVAPNLKMKTVEEPET